MNKCPLVLIEWTDSTQPASKWVHLSDFEKRPAIQCVSVGWLLDDGETKVLAPNMGDMDNEDNIQVSGVIHIPSCAVTKIEPLQEIKESTP